MKPEDFWRVITSAQVSTALVLIAAALVYLALRIGSARKSSS